MPDTDNVDLADPNHPLRKFIESVAPPNPVDAAPPLKTGVQIQEPVSPQAVIDGTGGDAADAPATLAATQGSGLPPGSTFDDVLRTFLTAKGVAAPGQQDPSVAINSKPVEMPAPSIPVGIDPEVRRKAAEQTAMAHALHGIVDQTVVTPYDVRHGRMPEVKPSPVNDALVETAQQPLQEAQAEAAHAKATSEIMNKFAITKASLQEKQQQAETMRAAAVLGRVVGAQGGVDKANVEGEWKARVAMTLMGQGKLDPALSDTIAQYKYQRGEFAKPSEFGGGKYGGVAAANIVNGKIDKLRAADGATGADLAAQNAGQKANAGALSDLSKQNAALIPFAKNAVKNFDAMMPYAKKLADVGSRWFNTPIRALQEATGDENIVQFNVYRKAALNELAKITSSASGKGSVVAQKERDLYSKLLDPGLTAGQFIASVQAARGELVNRISSQNEQVTATKKALGSTKEQQVDPAEAQRLEQKARARLAKDPKDQWSLDTLQALGKGP